MFLRSRREQFKISKSWNFTKATRESLHANLWYNEETIEDGDTKDIEVEHLILESLGQQVKKTVMSLFKHWRQLFYVFRKRLEWLLLTNNDPIFQRRREAQFMGTSLLLCRQSCGVC
ncbi:unnamed protein product [Brassica rapa subsp. trilocularis]